jgi:hypothetical protein
LKISPLVLLSPATRTKSMDAPRWLAREPEIFGFARPDCPMEGRWNAAPRSELLSRSFPSSACDIFPAPVVNKDARIKAVSKPTRTSAKAKALRHSSGQAPRARKATDAAAVARARRNWIVLVGLVAFMAITGTILKTLAPAPLAPDATGSLYAVGPEQISRIFDIPVALKPGRWHSIYVHHSMTQSGSAATLAQDAGGIADHFLIGNGDPIADGAVETGSRWSHQVEAGSVSGVEISPDCISICMVGDFNRARPSPTQQAHLLELVGTLQQRLS